MTDHYDFYDETLRTLIEDGEIVPERDSVLVICAADNDRRVLLACGFREVTISNVDARLTANPDTFAPYSWEYQEAQSIDRPDDSVDFVFVHSGLHHCYVPHQAMAEMLRVARKGVLLFEPYDNVMTRLGLKLGFGQRYELAAVYDNDCQYGGVGNSDIPNHIYRFNRSEIEKLAATCQPYGPHYFRFFHRFRIPWQQLRMRSSRLPYYAVLATSPLLKLFFALFPQQSNNFAAYIRKPDLERDAYPWIRLSDKGRPSLDREQLAKLYQQKGQ